MRQSHPAGCAECFCFGVTDECRSSNWPVQRFSFDDQTWRVFNETDGTLHGQGGRVVYERDPSTPLSDARGVYLEAPIGARSDYTSSYGLRLSFVIACRSPPESGGERRAVVLSDIQLVSDAPAVNKTLEFWSTEQPKDASASFRVVVTLLPEYFLVRENGQPATRAQLMMVVSAKCDRPSIFWPPSCPNVSLKNQHFSFIDCRRFA